MGSLSLMRPSAGRRNEFGILGRTTSLSRFDALANIGSNLKDFSRSANFGARELPQGHNERRELI